MNLVYDYTFKKKKEIRKKEKKNLPVSMKKDFQRAKEPPLYFLSHHERVH
jgi:hypothetical protein